MARAQEILVHHSLDQEFFCKTETKGDGNCFFHAIADQLTIREIKETVAQRARNIPLNHLIIRHRVVDFMRSNSDMLLQNDTILNYLQVLEGDDRENNPPGRDFSTIWRDYIRDMKKPAKYAKSLGLIRKMLQKDQTLEFANVAGMTRTKNVQHFQDRMR